MVDRTILMVHDGHASWIHGLLQAGEVLPSEVLAVVIRGQGSDYESRPHHQDAGTEVHILRRTHHGVAWYIKWYCLEPNVWFVSVHH